MEASLSGAAIKSADYLLFLFIFLLTPEVAEQLISIFHLLYSARDVKTIFSVVCVLIFINITVAQTTTGSVVTSIIHSVYLQNKGGENPDRAISVYLPAGYANSKHRYPVIYYLHGFMGTDSIATNMKSILDMSIAKSKIGPYILVIADNNTLYSGSFYSNSSLTGNWSEFEAKELVAYMDKNFRTIATRDARAIGGHSMGGYGALKIAMLYPDVFSCVYALSPDLLAFLKEFGPNRDSYKQLAAIKSKDALDKTYYRRVIAACARSWSPNANKPPF
ncbi:alpha/beta hydrolase [Segetibacter koreensis]|uniref:alpha/beta hydrolase n=1 Tax=Segetibacter koreensis TaxID=398037 RepID=UPI00036E5230|nr:alpha/beta hydrolase-fold protein [Segetibacter koreensis]